MSATQLCFATWLLATCRYELGAQLIVNNMFGDFIAMHLLLDFAGFPIDIVPMLLRAKLPFCCGSKRLAKWNINEWFAKRILPKLAHTQMAMDRLYMQSGSSPAAGAAVSGCVGNAH